MKDRILKEIAIISETEDKQKRLLLISHDGEELYDLREWSDDPLDGITMTGEELKRLGAAIKAATLYGGAKHE